MTNQMPGEGADSQPSRLPREHLIGCLHPQGHGCPLWVIHETLWSFLNDLLTPEIIKSIFDYQNNFITNKISFKVILKLLQIKEITSVV